LRTLTLRMSAAGTHARTWHFIVHACARCGSYRRIVELRP
jgi:hypothetical protein